MLEGERERSGKYVLVLGELLTPLGSPVKLLQFSKCISGDTGLSLELKVERLPEVTVSHCRPFRRKLSTNNTFEIDKSTYNRMGVGNKVTISNFHVGKSNKHTFSNLYLKGGSNTKR